MEKIAIFPGSFDPITVGHIDVLKSALQLFDKVVVAVGFNSAKKGFFDPDTRIEIIRQAVKDFQNVTVCKYDNLTIDFCKEIGAKFIIRGLRTNTDFEFESVIAQANKKLAPEISTIFIPATGENSFVSSTVVRDLIIHGSGADAFLPGNVDIKKFMDRK